MGPPADYPVMFRVSGYDTDKVKEIAGQVADVMRSDSNIYNVNFDWQEKQKRFISNLTRTNCAPWAYPVRLWRRRFIRK